MVASFFKEVFSKMPEIRAVVKTSSRSFHNLFFDTDYISNPSLMIFVVVYMHLKKTVANK